jgi:hypothetical protein
MKQIGAMVLIVSFILLAGCADEPDPVPATEIPSGPPTKIATFAPLVRTTAADPMAGPCDCSANRYNCDDFPDHSAAQECFERCRGMGKGDLHRLDRDKNGIACE